MKIEIHVYHHFVREEDDSNALKSLAEKLRTSSNKLAAAVAANTPANPVSTPAKEK
jgi:hypothetical protein